MAKNFGADGNFLVAHQNGSFNIPISLIGSERKENIFYGAKGKKQQRNKALNKFELVRGGESIAAIQLLDVATVQNNSPLAQHIFIC